MSRYIDADAMIARAFQDSERLYLESVARHTPSIDIVFCNECKWADWYKTADGKQFCYCMETGSAGRTADDFCSYGERKESE